MLLRSLLQQRLSRHNADRVLEAVLADRSLLPQLVEVFAQPLPKEIGLAAMALGNLARVKANWLQTYQNQIFEAGYHAIHPAILRNMMRIFSELPVLIADDTPIPPKAKRYGYQYILAQNCGPHTAYLQTDLEGPLLDFAIHLIDEPSRAVASRVFAMGLVLNLSLKYPDLRDEITATVSLHLPYSPPAFKSRGRMVLAALKAN